MKSKTCGWKYALGVCLWALTLSGTAWSGTFGRVVAIGGHAADLVLDEARGVLYIANFTANRIEVMSLADGSIQTSMNVAAQPGSMSLSMDGRYLLIAHFGNFTAPNSARNALTLLDLATNGRQTFVLGSAPLGVAFGVDNLALVVTTTEFLLFDPTTGATQTLGTVSDVTAKTLPQPPANFPPQIIAASVAASGDNYFVYGLSDTIRFRYDVTTKTVDSLGYTSSPAFGPRVVSVNRDGSSYAAGWGLFNRRGVLMAQFPNPSGALNIGSHAYDTARGLIYAQVPEGVPTTTTPGGGTPAGGTPPPTTVQAPFMHVVEADNLAVREKLLLAENLAGKSVMSSDGNTVYAISDSGVTILPVGALGQARRLVPSVEDLQFRGNFCDRRVATQEFTIIDASGAATDFVVTTSTPGISLTPSSGTTPATVRVRVDPNVFSNQRGTVSAEIKISSGLAVNLPTPLRVLINSREPDQRGTALNIPGKLVDLLPDPVRDRFFVLRQDKNQVLVFDGTNYTQIATLRTGNTPTQMAITFDRRYLLVGNENSQIANVFDLETLQPSDPIIFPFGHYPRSIAASGQAILAATRVAGPIHKIDRIDMGTRTASELPSLGVYENNINLNTVLVASGNGSSIMAAQADGNVLLYSGNADTFTISRKDFTALSGAYAASSFDQFVVGNQLFNASLVVTRRFESSTGQSSGFSFVDQTGFRTTAPAASSPGVIQRVDTTSGDGIRATRMVEAPLLGDPGFAFTRTLAPLYSRNNIVNLTVSGVTVLPWAYDASVAAPKIERVVNAADGTRPVAPGGLITVFGQSLSPVNIATREMPLPTALGESCITANGVPVPVLFVSPNQVNAQLPFPVEGAVTLILRTPGGVSDNFNLSILPAAPSVFRTSITGLGSDVPTVVRDANGEVVTGSNPIHHNDSIIIYLTGMGRTTPAVEAGLPSPADPLALALIPPTVTIGGVELPIVYAGLTPGQVGVYQINALVPRWVPTGVSQSLLIKQGSGETSLAVRVVN